MPGIVLALIVEGFYELALEMIFWMHVTCRHAKGMEDCFASLRRLSRKGSENKLISVQRLMAAIRHAVRKTFPNMIHPQAPDDLWEQPNMTRAELQPKVPQLSLTKGPALTKQNFAFDTANPGDCCVQMPDEKNERTVGAPNHSGQIAYEECLLQLPLDDNDQVTDWRPLTESWKSSLIIAPSDLLLDMRGNLLCELFCEVGLPLIYLVY